MSNNYKIETKCIQSGWQPTKGEPRVLPIYQSTTFKYDTSEDMGKLFDLEASGYFYTSQEIANGTYIQEGDSIGQIYPKEQSGYFAQVYVENSDLSLIHI